MRRVIPGLVLASLLSAAVGCGGGSSGAPATPATPATGGGGGGGGGGSGTPSPPPGIPSVPPSAVPAYHQMDPVKHNMPSRPVFGRIGGRGFDPKVVLTGNRLTLRQGMKDAPDIVLVIELPLAAGETADGRTFVVHPEQQSKQDPKITLKARGAKEAVAQEKFALTLTFNSRTKDGLPGKIQLALPDSQQSYVVGEFDATNE